MARFSDNPIKNPLSGSEDMAATDPSTGNDVAITPLILTQFVATHMAVAAGSSNGLIDPTSYNKLLALDTQAQTNTRVNQLAEVSVPVFFSAPADGTFVIYQHCLDVSWVLAMGYLFCSAGSTNVTVLKNGVAIGGFTSVPASSTPVQYTVSGGSSNYTFGFGDILSLNFAGTTGNCKNLGLSMRANATISP